MLIAHGLKELGQKSANVPTICWECMPGRAATAQIVVAAMRQMSFADGKRYLELFIHTLFRTPSSGACA